MLNTGLCVIQQTLKREPSHFGSDQLSRIFHITKIYLCVGFMYLCLTHLGNFRLQLHHIFLFNAGEYTGNPVAHMWPIRARCGEEMKSDM